MRATPCWSEGTCWFSGERGTGKTTLLLSLAAALRKGSEGPGWDERLPADPKSLLLEARGRVVWLDTLDMESLDSGANLLRGLLARVADVLGEHLAAAPAGGWCSHNSEGPDGPEVLRELRELQKAVALAHDGNLRTRSASLDLDLFAVESRRTERERIKLGRRFGTVLKHASRLLSVHQRFRAPLFLLPVDDLDLNPSDCVSLLALLRSVSSPYLLTLIAADIGMVKTIMRLKYQGDLGRISAPVPLTRYDQDHAANLASSALRKYLPRMQQVILNRLTPAETLQYKPWGEERPRHDILGPITLEPNVARVTRSCEHMPPHDTVEPAVSVRTEVTSTFTPQGLEDLARRYSWPEMFRMLLRLAVDLYPD